MQQKASGLLSPSQVPVELEVPWGVAGLAGWREKMQVKTQGSVHVPFKKKRGTFASGRSSYHCQWPWIPRMHRQFLCVFRKLVLCKHHLCTRKFLVRQVRQTQWRPRVRRGTKGAHLHSSWRGQWKYSWTMKWSRAEYQSMNNWKVGTKQEKIWTVRWEGEVPRTPPRISLLYIYLRCSFLEAG